MREAVNPVEAPSREGRQLAKEAADRAAQHADRVHADWQERAFDVLRTYCEAAHMNGQAELTGEMVRKVGESNGLPPPPDKRAWGSVMLRGARAGVIRKIGWTTAADPKVHANPISLWEPVHKREVPPSRTPDKGPRELPAPAHAAPKGRAQ